LQGASESDFRSLAEEGPIVVFNISDIRSDAFLITFEEIHAVRFPLLTLNSLAEFTERFFTAINNQHSRSYSHSLHEVNTVLKWLWDVVVSPLLDKLGFTSNEVLPREWWVTSGLLSMLPIHASGSHDSIPPQIFISAHRSYAIYPSPSTLTE